MKGNIFACPQNLGTNYIIPLEHFSADLDKQTFVSSGRLVPIDGTGIDGGKCMTKCENK